ncbi:MAG: AMP-binding protein [Candidatus Puniceispirillaceae bacterium]
MTQAIWQKIAENKKAAPDKSWLISPETGQEVSWAEAADITRDIAAILAGSGVGAGASIAIASPNSVSAALVMVGVTTAGYLATPLNLVAGSKVMRYVLNHCQAELILCAPESRSLVDEAVEGLDHSLRIIELHPEDGPIWPEELLATRDDSFTPASPDSPGILMYTSGTTGNPKGVVLTHANLLAAGQNVVTAHGLGAGDIGCCVLPIYHINGLCVTVMGTIMSGGGLVMPYRFSLSRFWQDINTHNSSWFSAVPTLFAYLLNDDATPDINKDRLRFSRSASAPLAPEIHRQFETRFGIPIIETMGLTETGAQILSNPLPPHTRKIGSPGIAIGNEVMIADDRLRPCPANQTGEILVRGDNVMQGYLHQPEETAKTITADGWMRTGDLGHMDEDGYVFVTGRIKELIIKGGENIAPREIDEVLLEHDTILEAAAFAVPCRDYGQRVEACICFKPSRSATIEDLSQHCTDRLGAYKTPDKIHILADLPKGPSGKIQRLKLHELVYGAP